MHPEHISVMVEPFLEFFKDQKISVFFDGTLGAGGHSKAILQAHPEIERLIGCDRDPEALKIARKNLEPWKDKIEFVHANFAELDGILQECKKTQVNGFFLI